MRREFQVRFCEGPGVRFPRATRLVILCRRRSQADEALRQLGVILAGLGLTLHPEKTRLCELGLGKEGFEFLGCHLRLVRSVFKDRTYLFRWPSRRAMNAIRARIRYLTDRRRRAGMKDIREVIRDLNPVLRGWGNYFRTGNAAEKFTQVDTYVWRRLRRFLVKRKGRNLRAGETSKWTPEFFWSLGLHRLRGTVRYPEVA